MNKILVPTDFSEQSENALKLASEIAKKESAELILLHVVEIPGEQTFSTTGEVSSSSGMDQVFVLKMIEKGKNDIAELAAKYESGVSIKTEVLAGNAFYNISEMINEHEMDLVVMGTSGASGWEEMLIGSNTEKVVRKSKCPVLSLKHEVKLADVNNILFASALENHDPVLVEKVKELAKATGATLHLVYVNTPNSFLTTKNIYQKMDEFLEKNSLDAEKVVVSDVNEEDGILYAAELKEVDMIAMGTHGRKGLLHLFSGSIAEDIVNHAKRPVFTYKIAE
jgi:nucleotide-binding universal stress UspA family protein